MDWPDIWKSLVFQHARRHCHCYSRMLHLSLPPWIQSRSSCYLMQMMQRIKARLYMTIDHQSCQIFLRNKLRRQNNRRVTQRRHNILRGNLSPEKSFFYIKSPIHCKIDSYFYGKSPLDLLGNYIKLISSVRDTDISHACDTVIKKSIPLNHLLHLQPMCH